ncbi:hypothetical protein DBR11_11580, partial [Pedobacter sp. HMWF019]|uniref:MAC/perforin domain-containing protein n=1 Tax=Pedobacter sp. HMWF019 TaxID=2056856 RepID=UPI000D429D74
LKSDSEILSKGNSKLSGGDGKWDLLGYGLDATGDMLDLASVSDAPIIDVEKFDNDYHTRIDLNGTIEGTFGLYVGYSALDYLNDVSNTKSFDGKGDVKIAGTEKGKEKNFSASLKTSSSNQTTNTYSSKYSYATYEAYQRVKRIRFTGDADMQLLMQYLTPEFINNIATKNADDLVKRYGTHVMLDISIGGCLRFNYRGVVSASSSTQEKKTKVSVGLGVSVLGIGVNLSPDKSKEEITKITSETSDKEYTGKYYGGTNSGQSISIDKDGRTTENINFSSWQQSVNDKNAALIDVGRAVFLYDFIADPVKKALVKAAVEKHIKDSQP